MTDLQAFEKYWQAAQQSQFVSDKVDILKKALDLYKGNVLESAADEHWLIPTASHYSLRYAGMVNELLKTLAEEKDFHNLHKYAAQALALDSGNEAAYYWLIYAMLKMGATELAKTQVQIAEENLTEEEFHSLITELKKAEIAPIIDDDRRLNAERMEAAFYSGRQTTPEPVQPVAQECSDDDKELLLKLLQNPEMAALLKSLAKNL